MLLVTFHGGSSGINNVYAYDTPDGTLATPEALAQPGIGTLSELRDGAGQWPPVCRQWCQVE